MQELSDSAPAKPLDPTLRGNDLMAQTVLLTLVNNPGLQDPNMSAADKLEQQQNAAMLAEAMGGPSAEEQAAQAAANRNLGKRKAPPVQPAPTPATSTKAVSSAPQTGPSFENSPKVTDPNSTQSPFGAPVGPLKQTKILFTGRSGVGKSFLAEQLGARVLEFDLPLGQLWLGPAPTEKEYAKLLAWANGVYSAEFPNTVERVAFIRAVRAAKPADFAEFGSADFLTKRLVEIASRALDPIVAVTDVQNVAQYNALKAAGFTPYHVVASQTTMQTRVKKPRSEQLAVHLDGQAVARIQKEPQATDKIPVVWSDPLTVVFSPRFYTVDEFKTKILTPAPSALPEMPEVVL